MKDLIVRWSDGTSEHWEVEDNAQLYTNDGVVSLLEGALHVTSVFSGAKSVNIIDQEEDGICLECPECVEGVEGTLLEGISRDEKDDVEEAGDLGLFPVLFNSTDDEVWVGRGVLVSVKLPDDSRSSFPIEDLHGFVRGFEAGSITA